MVGTMHKLETIYLMIKIQEKSIEKQEYIDWTGELSEN